MVCGPYQAASGTGRRGKFARHGYSIYLPQLKVLKTLRNSRQVRFEALLPRCIFFQPRHAEHSIAPVRSTKGVKTIVQFGGVPAVLQPDTLQSIRAFECWSKF